MLHNIIKLTRINLNKNHIIRPFKNFNDNRIITIISIKDYNYSNIHSKYKNQLNERSKKFQDDNTIILSS